MKNLMCIGLIVISSISSFGMEAPVPSAPSSSPRNLNGHIFEPRIVHIDNCICFECLDRACVQLEAIQSKLPLLAYMIKELKENNSAQAVASARMMSKIYLLAKDGKQKKLIPKKQDAKRIALVKRPDTSIKGKKHSSLPKLFSSGGPRLETEGDGDQEEEFDNLTDPETSNFKWSMRQVGGDLI
ncbi:MAG: hypothetical protein AMXMBFR12_10100 [Candidatus Babeliales bacterium]